MKILFVKLGTPLSDKEKYKIDISESVDEHVKKLIAKGYINTEK